jgi:hypothetical protein
LLHALDGRFAAYGWLTNTGVKFLIIVDMEGQKTDVDAGRRSDTLLVGLRDSDLKPASIYPTR